MPLQFDGAWRFTPPQLADGTPATITNDARWAFLELARRAAGQSADRQSILEIFKRPFARAASRSYSPSSTESWAEDDLSSLMSEAAANAPIFLAAMFEACETLRARGFVAPDVALLNRACAENNLPYRIEGNRLLIDGGSAPIVEVQPAAPSLAARAREILERSLARADELIAEGRLVDAVREVQWLIESVSTAFAASEIEGRVIEGGYFNEIAGRLRRAAPGTPLAFALRGAETLQSWLSDPAGGGLRHGLAFERTAPMTQTEARLYLNLTLSYLDLMLREHERIAGQAPGSPS